ncbi:MAG: division/cell wall cluster transcriptional repressor MraZ [Oscillospiraceae bacterium]|nr:division/cell wall cluster transcriptional repressor MraZ [Oscillospiraceae bacterium]
MYGKYRHSVDPKGRLFVPAKLREELGEAFYVTLGLDKCLTVHTQTSWDRLMEKYESVPTYQFGRLRFLLANVVKCEPDKQGRFLLPPDLRAYANITQNVVFIGQGTHAEIWDAEAYDRLEREQLSPENLLAAMKELDF